MNSGARGREKEPRVWRGNHDDGEQNGGRQASKCCLLVGVGLGSEKKESDESSGACEAAS